VSTHGASAGQRGAEGRVDQLVADLEGLADLLDRHGEDHWCRWARRSLEEIRRRDARGLDRLRQGYGGMGSLNDLVLDGDDAASRTRVNTELDALRERVHDGVTALLHGLRREGA